LSRFQQENPLDNLTSVIGAEESLELQRTCRQVYMEDSVRNYAVAITRATRTHDGIKLRASPRASLGLHMTSQCIYNTCAGRGIDIENKSQEKANNMMSH